MSHTPIRTALAVVAATLLTVSLTAQAKPNFSGRWTRVADPADQAAAAAGMRGGRGRGMSGWGEDVTVKQDATSLTVVQTQPDGTARTYVYKLDGSESSNEFPGRAGAPTKMLSRATWEGETLVINNTIAVDMGGNAMTITMKQVIAQDAKGTLTIDTTTGGMPGGQTMTSKAQYRKN